MEVEDGSDVLADVDEGEGGEEGDIEDEEDPSMICHELNFAMQSGGEAVVVSSQHMLSGCPLYQCWKHVANGVLRKGGGLSIRVNSTHRAHNKCYRGGLCISVDSTLQMVF